MNNIIKAILLSLIASFCAVLMDVFLKYAQSDTNVYTVGFIRFLIGFLILVVAEMMVRYSGLSQINFTIYFLLPFFLSPLIYFILSETINAEHRS